MLSNDESMFESFNLSKLMMSDLFKTIFAERGCHLYFTGFK